MHVQHAFIIKIRKNYFLQLCNTGLYLTSHKLSGGKLSLFFSVPYSDSNDDSSAKWSKYCSQNSRIASYIFSIYVDSSYSNCDFHV